MARFPFWCALWRNLFNRRHVDADLASEVDSYYQILVDRYMAKGFSAEEARRMVRLEYGGEEHVKETVRNVRTGVAIEGALQDVRYSYRTLLKSPAFTLTAILSLALAIGANTGIYTIVDAALLRPLPVVEPNQLFTLATLQIQEQGKERPLEDFSWNYPLYRQFREAVGSAARLGLFSTANITDIKIPNQDAPIEKATCGFVSGDAFDILGVPPALGRLFTSEEDRIPWGHPYAVISYDYWLRRFGGDVGVLGQRIQFGRHNITVVGVARKGFFGVEPGTSVDIWIPAMMYSKAALNDPTWGWFRILGRLSRGMTTQQVQARLTPVFDKYEQDLVRRFPSTPAAMQKQYRERPLLVHRTPAGASNFQVTFARPLWIVFGVGMGILLIACANVASLLLARAAARAGEMAMRISLGASRARLVRQLLTESLMLSLVAGIMGWGLGQVIAPTLLSMLSESNRPVQFMLSMDTRVLLFCAGVSTLAAVLFGLLPAWQASGSKPMREISAMRTQSGKLRLGRLFVGVQVAFAFALIITGGSFLYTLRNLFAVDTGFDPHHLAIVNISTELSDITQKRELNAFLDELQRRVETLAGIDGATISYAGFLFQGEHSSEQIIVPGSPLPQRQEYTMPASPRYFATMKLPLLAGREFEQSDRDYQYDGPPPVVSNNATSVPYFGNEDPTKGPRPVIVNKAFADRYYPNENPLEKVFQTPEGRRDEIIGVAANAPYGSLREGIQPIVYLLVRGESYVALYIRTQADLGSVVSMVRREADAMGHGTTVRDATMLDTLIGDSMLRERLLAGIGGAFALLGLLLAGIGLFGLLNYSVTRRTKEIGIRAALGARAASLVFLVLKDLIGLTVGGLAVGLATSVVLMTFVRSLLFEVQPVDPVVLTVGLAVFLAGALIAGGIPAGRAAFTDPMVALRT